MLGKTRSKTEDVSSLGLATSLSLCFRVSRAPFACAALRFASSALVVFDVATCLPLERLTPERRDVIYRRLLSFLLVSTSSFACLVHPAEHLDCVLQRVASSATALTTSSPPAAVEPRPAPELVPPPTRASTASPAATSTRTRRSSRVGATRTAPPSLPTRSRAPLTPRPTSRPSLPVWRLPLEPLTSLRATTRPRRSASASPAPRTRRRRTLRLVLSLGRSYSALC